MKAKRRMSYNLVEGQDRSMYDVVEETTGQVIKSFTGDKFLEARNFMRHLNLGGGFDGFTPSFVLKNFMLPTKKPINLI